jgi:uncharacterized protein (DUF1330 family)
MSAYIIARADINDWDQFRHYIAVTPSIIEKYRGSVIALSEEPHTLEGPDETRRIVILQFPSVEKAKEFYHSPEYREARKLREGAAVGELILIDGLVPG